jgi:hypothetical protein
MELMFTRIGCLQMPPYALGMNLISDHLLQCPSIDMYKTLNVNNIEQRKPFHVNTNPGVSRPT